MSALSGPTLAVLVLYAVVAAVALVSALAVTLAGWPEPGAVRRRVAPLADRLAAGADRVLYGARL